MKKIPLILVSGFLGSGKTSLLKNLLQTMNKQMKIAIVQNEFAPGTTDSKELKSSNIQFDLLEINNGSVFCACLLDTFVTKLAEFVETFQPEIVFLEATGLADPVSMGQILQSEEVNRHLFLAGIWTVVDCLNFSKAHQFVERVKHQIQLADVLLLNKSDLKEPGEELLEQLDRWNQYATRIITIHGYEDSLSDILAKQIHSNGKPTGILKPDEEDGQSERPDIGSCVLRSSRPLTREKIEDFWTKNSDKIQRMKGFVRTPDNEYLSVQSVYDDLVIEKNNYWNGPTELIFIGPGVQTHWISDILIRNK